VVDKAGSYVVHLMDTIVVWVIDIVSSFLQDCGMYCMEVISLFHRSEPACMVRPCSENGRRKITQNSIEVVTETKESTRKTEEKLDGRYKEGHERKKPK
jgi:hypothetical protein